MTQRWPEERGQFWRGKMRQKKLRKDGTQLNGNSPQLFLTLECCNHLSSLLQEFLPLEFSLNRNKNQVGKNYGKLWKKHFSFQNIHRERRKHVLTDLNAMWLVGGIPPSTVLCLLPSTARTRCVADIPAITALSNFIHLFTQ